MKTSLRIPIRWETSPLSRSIRTIQSALRGCWIEEPVLLLFISKDAGANWSKLTDLPDSPRRVWVDPKSPAESRTIFVGSVRALAVINGPAVHKLSVPEDTNDISLGFGRGRTAHDLRNLEAGSFCFHRWRGNVEQVGSAG